MKRTIAALISFAMLCCVSVMYGQAEEKRTTEALTVLEVKGDIFQKSSNKDTLVRIEVGEALDRDVVLDIVGDGSLKMKKASPP